MKTKVTFYQTLLLAAIFIFASTVSFAKDVSKETAKNVALNIYAERSGKSLKNVSINKVFEIKEGGLTCLYVITYSTKGFAVIAADDIVKPVLGYSFESYYDEYDLSPEFEFFILKRFRKQIYAAKQKKMQAGAETIAQWEKYSVSSSGFQPKSFKSNTPLLTSTWHQRWPYNAHCPEDTSSCGTCNGHTPVGCVATAMAQVLNYWHHPWHGTGSHSYTPDSHPEYGVQTADFANTYYNFDNMPDHATAYSEDLAELCYHCGVAVDMNYGPNGSGAWGWGNNDVRDALQNYFYFSDDGNDINRSSYTNSHWLEILNENLNNDWPVIYGGHDSENDSGHAFVLDANTVDNDDIFHINWGWGGSQNGWYSVDDLSPGDDNYDSEHHASVYIHPKTGSLSGTLSLAGSPYTFNYDQYINPGSQLTIEPGVEIIFNGRYKLVVQGQLNAESSSGNYIFFNAQIPEIGMQGVMFENLNDNSMDSSTMVNCQFEYGKGTWNKYDRLYRGGAIYCKNSSKILIENNFITHCEADYGGGIACYDNSAIKISDCHINNNQATFGAGVFIYNSDVYLSGNSISENSITEDFYSGGAGIFCSRSDIQLDKDVIANNTGSTAGGIYLDSSNVVLDSVVINGNYSSGPAGAVYAQNNSDIILNYCHLFDNLSNDGGGGFFINLNSSLSLNRTLMYGNDASYAPSIFLTDHSASSLNNSTLSGNGPGKTFKNNIEVTDTSSLTIYNSILWNNASFEVSIENSSSVNASYSIIENGTWTGTGISSADPMFTPSDYHLSWPDYPIPDGNKSAAIDSGDPASPDDPDGTRADMGYIPFEQTYTTVSGGNVSGTFSCANSPYYVFGDITVPTGEELVIEPCVSVIFRGFYGFKVEGRLLAEGTDVSRITIAAGDTLTGWQGMKFWNTNYNGQDSSKLVNCRITFGNADMSGSGINNQGGAIYFKSSSNVLVKNCLLNKNRASNAGGAIYIDGASSPAIIDNTFANNYSPSGGAIFFSYGAPVIQGGVIENNEAEYGGACYLYGSDPTFSGVTMKNNKAKFGGGIYMYGGSTPVFDAVNRCNIYKNYAYAAGLDFCGTDWWGAPITVNVDTFTVINPNKHFLYPIDDYNLNVTNGIIQQTSADLYVSMTGSDDNAGTTPYAPLKTLYMAMMKIMADESDTAVVHLETGTYSEGATGEVMPVNLRSNVSLIGTGMNEVNIYGEDKNQIIYCYDDSNFHIENLNFQGGNAENGGAVYLDRYSSPGLKNVRIFNSNASNDGGALYCEYHSSPVLDSVFVSNNNAGGSGGGISLHNYSNAYLRDVQITGNSANYAGGGLYASLYSDFTMENSLVNTNAAANGGGLAIYYHSDPAITNTTISDNEAVSYTGYPASGGGIYTAYGSDPVFSGLNITGNTSDMYGGGVYCKSNFLFKNVKINNNTSQQEGGGVYAGPGGTEKRFINTEICDNTSVNYTGGAVYISSSSPEFINATIANNSATGTDAAGICTFNSNPVIKNSILWNNDPTEFHIFSGSVTAEYSDIKGSWTGTGNIDSDPLFTNAGAGDYSLQELSPCIDAGNPDTTGLQLPQYDLAGYVRIVNDTVDMGAYEYSPAGNTLRLNITLFLEGPYNGTDMNTGLNPEQIPLTQPYDTAPWDYSGTESVASIPANVVDWVLIQIRDAENAASATAATSIATQAAFLRNDGTVVGLDGSVVLTFPGVSFSHNLYVVVWHRNHLGIMSANGPSLSGGTYNYDFSTAMSQAYGTNAQKDLGGGVFGMYAGDADANGNIENADILLWKSNAGAKGYLSTDFNMNGQVNNPDKNDLWNENVNTESQIP